MGRQAVIFSFGFDFIYRDGSDCAIPNLRILLAPFVAHEVCEAGKKERTKLALLRVGSFDEVLFKQVNEASRSRARSKSKGEKSGGSGGARTRNLCRDRAAL